MPNKSYVGKNGMLVPGSKRIRQRQRIWNKELLKANKKQAELIMGDCNA